MADEKRAEFSPKSNVTEIKNKFEIVRLAEGDVRCKTDHLATFRSLLLANEGMYPSIAKWYSNKVAPGIRHGERVGFVGYFDGRPTVTAVVKKGNIAKFCHLRIIDELQNAHLGELFFLIMALEIRDFAKNIYFTLPEQLWTQKLSFFRSFSFHRAEVSETQYRLFDREFQCSALFTDVWHSIVQKLPKIEQCYSVEGAPTDGQLLFSVKPQHAEKILQRRKTVEIRRKFSDRWLGHSINLYASAPTMSLIGQARIAGVARNKPDLIWNRFHDQIACSRKEFEEYAAGAEEVFAIELDHIESFKRQMPLAQMRRFVNQRLMPPQSYCTLEKNRAWAKAVSVASYLRESLLKNTMSFATTCNKTTLSTQFEMLGKNRAKQRHLDI